PHQATVCDDTVGSGAITRETRKEFFLENRRQRIVDIATERLAPQALKRLRRVGQWMEIVREKPEHTFDLCLDLFSRSPGFHQESLGAVPFFSLETSNRLLCRG